MLLRRNHKLSQVSAPAVPDSGRPVTPEALGRGTEIDRQHAIQFAHAQPEEPSRSTTRFHDPWISITLTGVSGPIVAMRTPSGPGADRSARKLSPFGSSPVT